MIYYAVYIKPHNERPKDEKLAALFENGPSRYLWAVCETEQEAADQIAEWKDEQRGKKSEWIRRAEYEIEPISLDNLTIWEIIRFLETWEMFTDCTGDLVSNLLDQYAEQGRVEPREEHAYELAIIGKAKKLGIYHEP